jgi:hypothetical protein
MFIATDVFSPNSSVFIMKSLSQVNIELYTTFELFLQMRFLLYDFVHSSKTTVSCESEKTISSVELSSKKCVLDINDSNVF